MKPEEKIANKLVKIADNKDVAKMIVTLPPNGMGLPEGTFCVGTFLTYLACCLKHPGEKT